MAGSALTSEDLRKAPYRTARCLLLEAGPWENPKSGILGGAAGNVVYGGTVNPPRNRKGGAGNPPPTGARASALPNNFREGGWKRGLWWNCEPTSQPKGRGWKPSTYGCARQRSTRQGPWFESDVGRGTGHGDWGEPSSFKKCSETPDGVTRGCRVDDVRGRGGSTAPPSGQHAGAIDLQPRHRREQLAVGAEIAWTTAAHAAMSDTAAAVRHLVVAFIRWHSFQSRRPGSCDIRRRCVPPAGVVSHPPASQRDPLRRRGQDGQDGGPVSRGDGGASLHRPCHFPYRFPGREFATSAAGRGGDRVWAPSTRRGTSPSPPRRTPPAR